MSLTDPDRFLKAILMAAATSEGLERLVKRVVKPEYPDAYLTGPGQDNGVDVMSDLGTPPARAWQAKNHFDTEIDWAKCRASLASAMKGPKPPHYTFVFPRKMRKKELAYWRETFHPTEFAKYEWLEALDFEDDLPELIKKDPQLIDEMTGGAVSDYALKMVGAVHRSPPPVSPSAPRSVQEMADLARRFGSRDKHFSYEVSGREAHKGDTDLLDKTTRFQLSHRPSELPAYTIALREGDSIAEVRAKPRSEIQFEAPEPWFAESPEGEEACFLARVTLAKGRAIELEGEHVGVKAGQIPDRFRDRFTADGITRAGTLTLGLSEPLALVLTLNVESRRLAQVLSMYRIPALMEDGIAWGGALGGMAVLLDLTPAKAAGTVPGLTWEVDLSVALAVAGENGRDALRGLGFAQAFGKAAAVHADCPELLPEGGIDVVGAMGEPSNATTFDGAVMIAAALAALEDRDGVERKMPNSFTLATRLAAQMTYQVLVDGQVRAEVEGEFELPIPVQAAQGKAPDELVDLLVELPPFTDEKTHLMARQQLVNIEPIEVIERQGDNFAVLLRARESGGHILLTRQDD